MAITKRVTSIVYNGTNYTPIINSAEVTVGGSMGGDGEMDEAGRYYTSFDKKPGTAKAKLPLTADFSVANFRGVSADLQCVADTGESYLITNAVVTSDLTVTSEANSIESTWTGDEAKTF